MNSLKIPESGVLLRSAPGEDSDPLPQQAFTISLSDNVIEGMIRCVQDGGDLQLALGSNPTLHYDSKSHRISPPSDDHPYDLYLTQPYNSLREGTRIPAMSLFQSHKLNKLPTSKSREAGTSAKGATSKAKAQAKSSNTSSASGLDSDIEALQNGIAAHEAAKEKSVLLSGTLDPKKAAKMKNKLSWGNGGNRSLSTSPALKPSSPLPNPVPSSVERVKLQRIPLVHELAVRDRKLEYLQKKWDAKPEDLRPALERVADYNDDSKTWSLRKVYWKELDVWNYDYDSKEDRQQAIKNAVRQYDKQRLSASEPEWERLNRKEDRGKGICLSMLQSRINKAAAPTIKVQKADEDAASRDDADAERREKHKSETMERSSSNPLPKGKKATGSEAQAKRLLGKTKSSQKASPTKGGKSAKEGARQPLSQEFVLNSDSSGDEAPIAKAPPPKKPAAKVAEKPAARPLGKPADKPAEKPTSKQAEVAAARPKAATPVQKPNPKPAPKRPLDDDDDSSSSSGTPLSKRIKPKQPLPSQSLKKHPVPADRRNGPRETMAPASKNKNNSPTKSSPLASSPPTNASDMSDEMAAGRKRKAEADSRPPPAKRQAAEDGVPPDVLSQAQRFRAKYSEYEALHHEISALDNPPQEKLEDLKSMRARLARLKEQIYQKYRG